MAIAVRTKPKVFGPFEVLAKIGRGGHATVYKVRHRSSGKIAALKVIPQFTGLSPEITKRFEREFRAIRPLRHPHIVRAVGWGEHAGFQYLAMEYVPGRNLADRLHDANPPPEETVAVFLQLADAVRYLHARGIVHRDIKPSNIFVTPANEAKLGDFGLIKTLADTTNLTQSRQSMGTIDYGPPEQFEDAKHADERSDLYSLAATLYTAFTGKFPFGNGGPMQVLQRKFRNQFVPLRMLVPALDPDVDEFVNACLRSNPAERPGRCEEFHSVLRNYRPGRAPDRILQRDAEARRVRTGDRRAAVRFAVDLTATLVPFHQHTQGQWDATVLDASAHGVRIKTARPVALHSVLQLTLGQIGRTELALVRWVKSLKDNTQIAGCSFIQPLSRKEFTELFLSSSR